MDRPTAALSSAANAGHRRADARARAEQGFLAVVDLADRGEHPRRRPRGPPAGLGVDHGDGHAPGGEVPGAGQADDAPAHHDDVGSG